MKTRFSAADAIARSISHTEIVLLVVPHSKAAMAAIRDDEAVTDLDYGQENNGDLDVWGKCLGDDFRLLIRGENDLRSI